MICGASEQTAGSLSLKILENIRVMVGEGLLGRVWSTHVTTQEHTNLPSPMAKSSAASDFSLSGLASILCRINFELQLKPSIKL